MPKDEIKQYTPSPIPENIVGSSVSQKDRKDFDRYEFYQLVVNEKNIFASFPELKQVPEFLDYKPQFIKGSTDEICIILRFFSLVYNHNSPLIKRYDNKEELKLMAASCIGWNHKDSTKKELWSFVNNISDKKLLKLLSAYYSYMGNPQDVIKLRKLCLFELISQQNYELIYSRKLTPDDKPLVDIQKGKLDLLNTEYSLLQKIAIEMNMLEKENPTMFAVSEEEDIFNEYYNNKRHLSLERMSKTYKVDKEDENT